MDLQCFGAWLARGAFLLMIAGAIAGPSGVVAQSASSTAPASASAKGRAAAPDAHRREDIARHRALAAVHEEAARCLESGRRESECHDAMRKACEGLAVGRYCGMKHVH
jgi:hypothetical protein